MPTRASIQKAVIARLGSEPPNSLGEDSDELQALAPIYASVVEEALTRHAWTFARRDAALTYSSSKTPPLPWTVAFPKPADCLTVREVLRAGVPADYELAGEWIYANDDDTLTLIYTASDSEESWPADFAGAIQEECLGRMYEAFEEPARGADHRKMADQMLRRANARDARQRPSKRGMNARMLKAWYMRAAGRV